MSIAKNVILLLTDAANSEQAYRRVGGITVGIERLQHVYAEGECDDGLGTGSHDHALDPESNEGQERPESLHDVGVVGARLRDHAAQLGVAVSPHLEDK